MWDISWLPGPVRGMYYYLYLILDLYSRKIVGWEIWEEESAELASRLIRKAYMAEGIGLNPQRKPLILHSDNGSPMKGSTMLETLYQLGVQPSAAAPGSAMTILMQSPYFGPANTVRNIRKTDLSITPPPENGCIDSFGGTTRNIAIVDSNS